ncbi:MAG: GTPase Era [Bacillota bacterium]
MSENDHRSGFVSIIGRPNVGKSTLLNRLVGSKVAIISDKPQTTRHRIQGVLTLPDAQIIFLDTPGIHKPRHQLGQYMVKVALNTLREVGLVLFLVEANAAFGPGDEYILERLISAKTPVVLCINKIDLMPRESLLPLIADLQQKHNFEAIVPLSAFSGENTDRLMQVILSHLPPGPRYYPPDEVTDQPEKVVIAELIREKVLHLAREEVPHGVTVTVEEMELRAGGKARKDGSPGMPDAGGKRPEITRVSDAQSSINPESLGRKAGNEALMRPPGEVLFIRAVIYTERDSHKAIIVGRKGQMLKNIGQLAREEIEALFGSRVYLDLWVKVKPNWRRNGTFLGHFGYQQD